MLTIGELAAYADVTTRTIRHYHALGLLPEPPRDELGYRRYGPDHLLALQQITVLAAAGVPLRRIPEILDATPGDRGSALDAIDADLAQQQRDLALTRECLKGLRDNPDGLPPLLGQLIARLEALGIAPAQVALERDAWRLTWLLWGDLARRWLPQQLALLDDPEYADLYCEIIRLTDADPDDPRLEAAADRNVRWTLERIDAYETWANEWGSDPRASQLMEAHTRRVYNSPAFKRLEYLIAQKLNRALGDRARAWPER